MEGKIQLITNMNERKSQLKFSRGFNLMILTTYLINSANQMVECKNSKRLGSDPTIGGVNGASSYWQFQPSEVISGNDSRGSKAEFPDSVIELLNNIKLADNSLNSFGATSAILNAADISKEFGYQVDWNITKISNHNPSL